MYWSNKPIPENPHRTINTVPYNKPRLIYSHEASAVEATAYALMAYLRLNRVAQSLPIMKWLQTMRNSIGGFGSTRVGFIKKSILNGVSVESESSFELGRKGVGSH